MKNLVFSSKIFKGSRYGKGHPLDIDRVWPSIELLKIMNWVDDNQIIFNDPASIEELTIFHDLDYLNALKKLKFYKVLIFLRNKSLILVWVLTLYLKKILRPWQLQNHQ